MAQQVLRPEHRDGSSFGPEIAVDDRAPTFERLMAFMGRAVAT